LRCGDSLFRVAELGVGIRVSAEIELWLLRGGGKT
jgi:hypothetical protein